MEKENLVAKLTREYKTTFEFEDFFARLQHFYSQNGRFPKQRERDVDGYRIGTVIDRIRSKNLPITPEQIKTLEDFGLKTTYTQKNNIFIFEEFTTRCINFKKRNGRWPHSADIDVDGYPIGQKVFSIVRQNIKLSKEQHKTLKKLGIVLLRHEDYQFNDFCFRFKRAYDYWGRHPASLDLDPFDPSYKLGVRVSHWRCHFDRLTKEQQKKLKGLGFDTYSALSFKEFCFRFERAVKHLGRTPKTTETDPLDKEYNLGLKMRYYRRKYKNLSKEQQDQLDSLGIWGNITEDTFKIL